MIKTKPISIRLYIYLRISLIQNAILQNALMCDYKKEQITSLYNICHVLYLIANNITNVPAPWVWIAYDSYAIDNIPCHKKRIKICNKMTLLYINEYATSFCKCFYKTKLMSCKCDYWYLPTWLFSNI